MATHAPVSLRVRQVALPTGARFAYYLRPLTGGLCRATWENQHPNSPPSKYNSVDFQVQRCSRRCSATDKEFQPGEVFYSLLIADGAEIVRRDFSESAWEGPPENAVGWWQSQMPSINSKKIGWAPNDVMLEFFQQLADKPEKEDLRYILTLLLIRRRVMRLEETELQEGREQLVVYCSRQEQTYRVTVVHPDPARTQEIQDELATLLLANTDG